MYIPGVKKNMLHFQSPVIFDWSRINCRLVVWISVLCLKWLYHNIFWLNNIYCRSKLDSQIMVHTFTSLNIFSSKTAVLILTIADSQVAASCYNLFLFTGLFKSYCCCVSKILSSNMHIQNTLWTQIIWPITSFHSSLLLKNIEL